MNRLFLAGMAVIFIFAGCGRAQTSASWAFGFIRWNHHVYKVTSENVEHIGTEIGTVTSYSDREDAPETGTFSNEFPVGTKLYSITHVDASTAIAVQVNDGSYVKAVDQEPSQ